MAGPKLSQHHLLLLRGAETLEPSPIPTRLISNAEYMPLPRTPKQNRWQNNWATSHHESIFPRQRT